MAYNRIDTRDVKLLGHLLVSIPSGSAGGRGADGISPDDGTCQAQEDGRQGINEVECQACKWWCAEPYHRDGQQEKDHRDLSTVPEQIVTTALKRSDKTHGLKMLGRQN